MSQSIKSDRISESTIARIAGNLLSGFANDVRTDGAGYAAAKRAVRIARAIAAEVERTNPQSKAVTHG